MWILCIQTGHSLECGCCGYMTSWSMDVAHICLLGVWMLHIYDLLGVWMLHIYDLLGVWMLHIYDLLGVWML